MLVSQSLPAVVTAEGNQAYCPLTQQNIVTAFDITDPDSNSTEGFFIQVSTGFVLGEDQLILTGNHPNIIWSWNPIQAKLSLTPASGTTLDYVDIIAAVLDVVFYSSNINVGPKTFSLTLGEANFLNDHYYEFVPSQAITWTAAKIVAESMEYYGLQGYLATITDADEAQICGELSSGTGWIGGSDQDAEGVWKWMTGPESGTVFWNGGPTGSAPAGMYSNWNPGEPNNSGNNEDYAHITDPSVGPPGSWNDLPNATNSQPPEYTATGFLVEYGGMPGDPDLSISATTNFFSTEILSTTPSTSCENEIANLQATANAATILWYENQFGGPVLASGNVFNPVLTTDTTFWVLASSNGCEAGPRVPVNATVIPNETPVFEPIEPQCYGAFSPLPTTDINGISGSWNPAFDPSTTTTYNFIPDADQCAVNVEITVEIIQPIVPDFTQIDDVCEGTNLTLPTISNDNISGSWLPAFDPTTSTTYSFTPDAGQCANTTSMTIAITPLITPTFSAIPPLCEGTSISLPTTSIENITGTWSPNFDPTATTTYSFSPNSGQCADTTTQITVLIVPSVTPVFNPISPICVGDIAPPLPNISNNGIEGTWLPALIDNTTTANYVFTPNDTSNCEIQLTMTVTILGQTTPTFQIEDICIGEAIGALPTVSIEGITGSWFPAPNSATTTTYTFTPNPNQCANTATKTVAVNPINSLSIEVNNSSEPFAPNQIIEVSVTGGSGNYEYQLDNGNWQNNPIFQNVVGCDEHFVKVRDAEGCSNEPEKTITILDYPKFFTPNGDGYNDFWNILCLEDQTAMVSIFDRQGKLLRTFKTTNLGWNGTYNGQMMPANDYWFLVTYFDSNGIENQFSSHFSLRR